MKRMPVDSSNISEIGYDPTSHVLEVAFKSGAVYQYKEVPASLHELLMSAASKGTFLSRFIKRDYAFERLAGPAKAEESQHAG